MNCRKLWQFDWLNTENSPVLAGLLMKERPAVVESTGIENESMQGTSRIIHLRLTGYYMDSPLFTLYYLD
jgi:hypothetical protein